MPFLIDIYYSSLQNIVVYKNLGMRKSSKWSPLKMGQSQIKFLVNAFPPIPLDKETSNFAGA